jgi:tetratricopeptide (TPR) repeat protein
MDLLLGCRSKHPGFPSGSRICWLIIVFSCTLVPAGFAEDAQPDSIATRIGQAMAVLRLTPDSGPAHMDLGLAYWSRGNLVGARTALESAIRYGVSSTDSSKAFLLLAETALRQGRPQSATRMLQTICKRGSATPEILMLLAQMRWDDHRRDDALALGMAALSRDPFDVHGLRWISERWKEAGRPDLALAARDRVRALGAAEPEDLFQIGFLAQQIGDQQRAVDGYSELLAGSFEHPQGNYNMSLLLLQAGDTLEAIRHLERSIGGHPKLVPAFMDLAILYMDRNRVADVRRVLQLFQESGEGDSVSNAEVQSIIESLPKGGGPGPMSSPPDREARRRSGARH